MIISGKQKQPQKVAEQLPMTASGKRYVKSKCYIYKTSLFFTN